ncbi:MAG: GAF domain-containing protein [Candidatus Krumholzibacteriota bacterium]|nr:GAF domain-containing protein [Candidatus Krumholzibacteriota bacterium]
METPLYATRSQDRDTPGAGVAPAAAGGEGGGRAVFEAVSRAAARFLGSADWMACLDEVLADLGRAAQTSRVGVLQLHDGTRPRLGLLREWRGEAVPATAADRGLPLDAARVEARWGERLRRGEAVFGAVEDLPPQDAELLAPRGVRSLLVAPILVAGGLWGLLGVADCVAVRRWLPGEVDALRAAAATLGAAIQRLRAENQLRRSLAEKETLLREVHHRVKNNLQVVSSLLALQQRELSRDADRLAFAECQGRIRSMALVHEKLHQDGAGGRVDLAEYVRDLAAGLLRMHGGDAAPVLDADLAPARCDLDTGVPLGLLLNELITNAIRHAFPAGRAGRIRVAFRRLPGGEAELVVADDGVGLPAGADPAAPATLGLQLVQTLTRQLGGRIDYLPGDGTTARVRIPWPPPGRGGRHGE